MSFLEQNNKYFLGSYPQKTESLTKVSVIIIVGGVMKYDYARKEHLKKITPDTIKQKAIVVWADMSVGTLSDAVNFSLEMSKKSGLEVTDNKLLLYSGASETRLPQIKQANISYIGLMDPSPGINAAPVILNSISSHEKKIRMIYRVDNWEKKFHNNFPPLAQKIKNGGGKADTVSYLHPEIPARFLQDFINELVSPSSQQSTQQNTAASKPTTAKASPNQAANNPNNPNNNNTQQTEAPVNSGILDIDSLKKFEKMAISDDDDMFIPTIDKTSTLGGFLKNLSEKEHREDYLKDKHIFEGIVCRVPTTYSENDYKTEDILSSYETSERQYIYKVRVPEIDSAFMERPKTFDETDNDRAIINSLKDFRAPSDLIIRVGDRVKVTYGDLRRYKEGKILSRIPENIQDRIPLQAQATSEGSPVDGAFNGERAPVTVSAAGEVTLPGATWTIGKNRYDGNIVAKPVGVHKGETQYLESKAADRYLQMKDVAAKEGINLHVNSGFRDFNQQKALRDRYLSGGQKYPANDPYFSPPAGHRAGNAADIQVGSFSSKEYMWLFKNAPKYDWYNSGRFVTPEAEPHHHQFAPPGSAAISMGQVSRAIPYHKGGIPYTGERAAADNTTPAKKAESNP